MGKKESKRLAIVFAFFLVLGICADVFKKDISLDGSIERGEVGEGTKDLELIVEVEDVLEEQVYEIEVEPKRMQEKEAYEYFQRAIEEIEKDFESWEEVVPVQETYASNMVKAEWTFSPMGYVRTDGEIVAKEIPKEGVLITAKTILSCDDYEEIYQIPFRITQENLSETQRINAALDVWFEQQRDNERIFLPEKLEGYTLKWTSKGDSIAIKILLLEIVAFFLILYLQKRQRAQEEKTKREQMERDYPELVAQLSILLESGMTMRQAWNKIAKQYEENRKSGAIEQKEVYQKIVNMCREITEGVKERVAYQQFAEEISLDSYRRMIRVLLGNLEKGNRDICAYLEEESARAFEEKILFAKKQGEEASAKMLFPMMLMMLLVIVIIMVPAFIGFTL